MMRRWTEKRKSITPKGRSTVVRRSEIYVGIRTHTRTASALVDGRLVRTWSCLGASVSEGSSTCLVAKLFMQLVLVQKSLYSGTSKQQIRKGRISMEGVNVTYAWAHTSFIQSCIDQTESLRSSKSDLSIMSSI
jgi:hypothetical protein